MGTYERRLFEFSLYIRGILHRQHFLPGIDLSLQNWLVQKFNSSAYIGLDPRYYGKLEWDELQSFLDSQGHTLTPMININDTNIVDLVWKDERPDCPKDAVRELNIDFSGRSSPSKVRDVRQVMENENVDVLVVTELDEVACMYNKYESNNFVFKKL